MSSLSVRSSSNYYGIAKLAKPTDRLKNFKVKLQPMLGCVAVAPPNRQAFQPGNLGRYGGNMDYNQFRDGTTFYLSVNQPGRCCSLGDGHAAQVDVEFTVNLIPGKSLGQPRAEMTSM